jgi:hypothetical protein
MVINLKKTKETMKMFNKNRMAWTISALFLVAITSCSKDEVAEQPAFAGAIRFTAEQAGMTLKSAPLANDPFWVTNAGSTLKTTLLGNVTWWTANVDKTGIYAPEAYTAINRGGTLGIVNNQYTAKTTAASSEFTPLTSMYWNTLGTIQNFYAYYPYSNSAIPDPAAEVVPVGLLSTQAQLVKNDYTHIGALDFLVATPITATSPGIALNTVETPHSLVHLVYNHLFTIVEFNIAGSGTIGGIRLSGTNLALAGAYVDIKQAKPADGVAYTLSGVGSQASAVIVNLATPAVLTGLATDTKVYMVIYPGYTGSSNIEFLNSLGEWKALVAKAAPIGGGGFLRGQYYTATITGVIVP